MSVSLNANRILAAAIAALLAVLAYWLAGLLGANALLALGIFGFVLIAVSVSIQ